MNLVQACQIGKCVRIDPFQWIVIQMEHTKIAQWLKSLIGQLTKSIETQIEFFQFGHVLEMFRWQMFKPIPSQGKIAQGNEIQQCIRMEILDSILIQDQSSTECP